MKTLRSCIFHQGPGRQAARVFGKVGVAGRWPAESQGPGFALKVTIELDMWCEGRELFFGRQVWGDWEVRVH